MVTWPRCAFSFDVDDDDDDDDDDDAAALLQYHTSGTYKDTCGHNKDVQGHIRDKPGAHTRTSPHYSYIRSLLLLY